MEKESDKKTLASDLGNQLQRQKDPATSQNLGKHLCLQLISLIDDVNRTDVTPESVNAACNAAAQVHKILRLNFDMRKEGF